MVCSRKKLFSEADKYRSLGFVERAELLEQIAENCDGVAVFGMLEVLDLKLQPELEEIRVGMPREDRDRVVDQILFVLGTHRNNTYTIEQALEANRRSRDGVVTWVELPDRSKAKEKK